MIYMVEHTFSMPQLENEWNTWYAGNLHVLLSVPGIESAQRFRVPEAEPSRFMAMYTIAGPEVFDTDAYRNAGGGGANSVRFRPAYKVWIRNVFAGIEVAPDVQHGQCLLSIDAEHECADPAVIAWQWGRSVALHRTTPVRGLAVVSAAAAQGLAGPGLTVYEPHGARLTANG
jgi:hypothetical protein